ncbi:hypothetical protein C8R47DRAFT_133835 [Mycena vitilis]|nr:hypothetical protein C8R47DRAFT_133835 [Mycena vitilis]
MAYVHKHWTKHYTPDADHHKIIQTCLLALRARLEPLQFASLSRDVNATMRMFLHFINFLKIVGTTAFAREHIQEYEAAWDTLLGTLFGPDRNVAQFLEVWTPGYADASIVSSLGAIFYRLSNTFTDDVEAKMHHFLNRNSTPQTRYRLACITMRLLVYRSAENRANMLFDRRIQNLYTRIVSEAPLDVYHHSLQWSIVCWCLASQWCLHLVWSPPAPELLFLLRQLLQSGVFLRRDEIHYDLLNDWLMEFGTEAAMEVARVFRHVQVNPIPSPVQPYASYRRDDAGHISWLDDAGRCWVYVDFWQSSGCTARNFGPGRTLLSSQDRA